MKLFIAIGISANLRGEEFGKIVPKILHLTSHKGCVKEIASIAKVLGLDIETWFIPELPPRSFDGVSCGSALYNIGHERAERIWKLHQKTFEQFDAVITSDTAPLARIFLQNGFTKPLIIWICCRFDYCDYESLDCDFPDAEFYQLFNQAHAMENVAVIAYTSFEHYHAREKGVETGALTITPCCPGIPLSLGFSSIPSSIVKEETFFLPPYSNETQFMDLSSHCAALGIPNHRGRYNGPEDLADFKGIIHLPYAWSNLAFFENISFGIPYFIPSRSFLTTLIKQGGYWHTEPAYLICEKQFDLSEWYKPEREEIIVYFNSWEDLKYKINTTDYPLLRKKIRRYAEDYKALMLDRWKKVFSRFNL